MPPPTIDIVGEEILEEPAFGKKEQSGPGKKEQPVSVKKEQSGPGNKEQQLGPGKKEQQPGPGKKDEEETEEEALCTDGSISIQTANK